MSPHQSLADADYAENGRVTLIAPSAEKLSPRNHRDIFLVPVEEITMRKGRSA